MNNETNQKTSKQKNKKLLDPKIDAVFQILFSKNNLDITKALLSAILDLEIKQLTNKTLSLDLNKILDRTYPSDKIGVLDLRAQINNEIELDLEMQMLNKEALIERVLWYWSKMYSSQLTSGDDYPKLKKTIEILIVNEPISKLETIEKPCTKWHIREEELCSFVLTNKLEIIIIELPKVKQAFLEKPESLLYQWMMFLLNPESEEVSQIMNENEDIKNTVYTLEEISEDEYNRRLAELREKAIRDELTQYNSGVRAGIKQGLEQAKIQLAKKMLAKKMNINEISEITELSMEEIKKLQVSENA